VHTNNVCTCEQMNLKKKVVCAQDHCCRQPGSVSQMTCFPTNALNAQTLPCEGGRLRCLPTDCILASAEHSQWRLLPHPHRAFISAK
jgi:hypothetical protein